MLSDTKYADDDVEVGDEEEVPFDVNDEVEVDFDDAPSENQPLPTARNVPASIVKGQLRRRLKDNMKPESSDNPWQQSIISVQFAIDKELGIDGHGKFGNKRVFFDYVYAINKDDPYYKGKDKWMSTGDGWAPVKTLFIAVTGAAKGKVGDAFLEQMKDVPVFIDIINKPKRVKDNVTGEWVNSDENKNDIKNLKRRDVVVAEEEED
jgi:hypothetical protein